MNLTVSGNVSDYIADVRPFLEKDEAENGLFLGNLFMLEARPAPMPFMAYVREDGDVVLAAFYREINLIVSRGPRSALAAIVRPLLESVRDLPGVVGPAGEAEAMASAWARMRGCASLLAMNQLIYKLTEVRRPSGMAGGMRPAAPFDAELLSTWVYGFHVEALPEQPCTLEQARQNVARRLAADMTFIWETGGRPVAMASLARPTARGVTVNAVYTPPEHRRQGYATALVADVSAEGLRRGKEFCTLYTDRMNPTSNSIYRKIGYEPICESRLYRFRYA